MGKSSATPPVPDYRAAAEETAAGNLENARQATAANRPNQITPYGSSTWTQGGSTRSFNQERYDAAAKMAQDQAATAAISGAPGTAGGGYWQPGNQEGEGGTWVSQPGTAGTPGTNPTINLPDRNADQFWDMTPSDNWTQTVTLDPQAQETLDKQMGLSNRYADIATKGLDKAEGVLSDPTLDMSGIPARAINQGQTAQQAIMARLNPQFQQEEEQLRTRLANQGLSAGSEAFNNDFTNFNHKRNDAEMQAALYGIGLDNTNRSSALQEQAYAQDRPLNLINALRTGAQVQSPTFGSFAQQQATSGPDYTGAANADFQGQVGNANVKNAASNAETSGVMSAAAMAAMMMF